MKKYLVIGNPIEHSLSPKLHNFWLKNNNIDAIYEMRKVESGDLKNLVLDIKRKNISGFNVTVPFKNEIIHYLDELSLEAKITQSVNTVCLEEEKIIGYNTDIIGFELGIKNTKFSLEGKKVFILGAGGVVPSIIFALNKIKVSEIIISNRTLKKAENLKKIFTNLKVVSWGEVPNFDMIINATSVGLNNNDELNIDLSKVGKKKLFYDVIYNPSETRFLRNAKQSGNKIENGRMMFIYQASAAFKLWHGVQPKINKEIFELF